MPGAVRKFSTVHRKDDCGIFSLKKSQRLPLFFITFLKNYIFDICLFIWLYAGDTERKETALVFKKLSLVEAAAR